MTFRYPPLEVLSTVTFDASEIVTMLMQHVPQAAVAVEDIGVGYRINRPFPDGEITGGWCCSASRSWSPSRSPG